MAEFPEHLKLEIVSPDRSYFSGEVSFVQVPGREGYLGICPGHTPLLSELKTGVVSFRHEGIETRLYCGWGFVEVLPDQVSILIEEAQLPHEIDVEQARADQKKAEEMLQAKDGVDFEEALLLYHSAYARLEAAGQEEA